MEEFSDKTPKNAILCCIVCRKRMAIKGQTVWEDVRTPFFEWFMLRAKVPKAYSCCDLCKRRGTLGSLKTLYSEVERLTMELEKVKEKKAMGVTLKDFERKMKSLAESLKSYQKMN